MQMGDRLKRLICDVECIARGSFSRLFRCCVWTCCLLFLSGSDPTFPLRMYSNADCLLYTPIKLCWSMNFTLARDNHIESQFPECIARGSFSRLFRCCVRTCCLLFLSGSDPTFPLRMYSNADCLLYTPNKLCRSMIFILARDNHIESQFPVTLTCNNQRSSPTRKRCHTTMTRTRLGMGLIY